MFAKIAVLALVAACFMVNTEAYYVASPAYAAAYPSAYAAAYSPYYYGAYTGYAAAAYPSYWGWGSNKNGADNKEAPKPAFGASLTNNQ
ncbi:unnamed protein product [Auanema sp. JU1783]|nr:unnamed protein product [Auanema sp. JU1783]